MGEIMFLLPGARTENIAVQHLKDEVLIYDLTADRAFCLNKTAALVFNACDGETPLDHLKDQFQLTDEIIFLALDDLKKDNLIGGDYVSPLAGINRRQVIRQAGLASMIALPIIAGLTAPTAANAASVGADNGVACATFMPSGSRECKSGNCASAQRSTYSYADGTNSQSSAGTRCCISGETVGTYTTYSTAAGFCNFSVRCCTGSGTETFDSTFNRNVCTCAATS